MEVLVLIALLLLAGWLVVSKRRQQAVQPAPSMQTPMPSTAASGRAAGGHPTDASPAGDSARVPGTVRLSSDGRLSVVGESHYQPALHAAVAGRNAQGFDNAVPVTAVLVPEPSNPYDGNAVRVDVAGRLVGYLAREDAVQYQPPLLDLAQRGLQGACPAFICSGGAGMYGIWLHIAPPDRLLPLNAADGLNLLRGERQITVTGEENHQQALLELAKRGRGAEKMSLFAELTTCEIAKGKHRGETGVEVLIDGVRVGELTKLQSDRYLGQVQRILARGQRPGCDATLRHADGKGWQVELQLPTPDREPLSR